MSIIQASIIASSTTSGGGGPNWQYPPPGNNYPVPGNTQTGPAGSVSGYYEVGSLLNGASLGLYRRTYTGTAFGGDYVNDSNFPGSYSMVQQMPDSSVGFGFDLDVATNFTMEWLGYYRPAVTGNFVFVMDIDDYAQMWIGQTAVTGFDHTNAIMQANNDITGSPVFPMVANRYYPVRIRYVENSGGHRCTIWSGLDNTSMFNNQGSSASGQFFYDTNTAAGGFPSTGLIL